LQADGTFDQQFTVRLENTGDLSMQLPIALDDLETQFGAAFDPSTAAANATSGVTVAPAITASGNTSGGAFLGGLPAVNAGFDGETSTNLFDGVTGTLQPNDFVEVTFTVLLNAAELSASSTNTVSADASPPGGIDLPVTGTDENGAQNTTSLGGDAASSFTVPAVTPELTIAKVADDSTDRALGDTITYTYTATNTGNVNISDVTVSDSHSGTGTLSPITIDTLTNTSGSSTDDGADNDVDLLAPGDSVTFEATYVVTFDDAVAGTDITNTATATGTPVAGTLTDPTASETVTVDQIVVNQVTDVSNGQQCLAAGGTLVGPNIFTAADSIEISSLATLTAASATSPIR